MLNARVMRITRITSHPHMGPELFRRLMATMDIFEPTESWFGRQDADRDRVVIVVVSAWFDAEAIRSRFHGLPVGQPYGFDAYRHLVESFEIEHYEYPWDGETRHATLRRGRVGAPRDRAPQARVRRARDAGGPAPG